MMVATLPNYSCFARTRKHEVADQPRVDSRGVTTIMIW